MHGDFTAQDMDAALVGGVSMLSGYVDKVRMEDPNTIYCIAGDMFRGSVIDSEFKGLNTIEIMNAIAPDVVTLLAVVAAITACGNGGTDSPDAPKSTPALQQSNSTTAVYTDSDCENLRRGMAENQIAAVAYIGWYDDWYYNFDFDYVKAFVMDSGITKHHPFVEDIDYDHYVMYEGGEIYCILPKDPQALVTIYDYIVDETNGYYGEAGDVIFESDDGQPVILMCNESEIVPNVLIEIVDSDGNILEYTPCLSGYNYSIEIPYGEPTIYDFSAYNYKYADYGSDTDMDMAMLTYSDEWSVWAYTEDDREIEAAFNFTDDGEVYMSWCYDDSDGYEVYYEGIIYKADYAQYSDDTAVMELYKTADYSFDEDAAEYICLTVRFEKLEEDDEYITMYRVSGDRLFGNEDSDEYEMYSSWG